MSAGPQHLGRTIAGRFRITGLIGEGAMAAVYRGEQDAEPRDVAIKIMHPQLLGDRTFVGRFRREAKAASRLKHPNTVQIVESGVDGNLPFIVMELVSGQDLFDLLAAERRLSEARAVRILMSICEALGAAHEQGIVHRDLKPENVMIVRDPADPSRERVKVLDFGIAKMVEGGRAGDEAPNSLSNSALTTVGVVVGTPAYMSPEQCKGDPVDGRSDVYACGILLFLLVTGRLPFLPTSIPWEVAVDHLRKPPPAPSTFLPQIHPALEATILTALSKWPGQRQQSAIELRDELSRLLPQLPDMVHAAISGAALRDAPTMESMPVSIRSRVTVSTPIREVEILPAPPISVVTPSGPLDAVLRMPERPPSMAPPSEQPPSSEMVIHHRSDIDGLLAARKVDGGAARRGAPAAPARKEATPRPSLASLPGVAVAIAQADPRASVRKRARQLPARATDSWVVKLVVPLAVLFGLVLGVLAFLLSR